MSDINPEDTREKKSSKAHSFALGELCFIVLPFLVMTILFAYKNNLNRIFKEPEWSLAASVMFGQSIIKLVHYMGKIRPKSSVVAYRVGTIISFLILLGLVPSLTVLALIYTSESLPTWLIVLQIILFVIAILVFYFINYGVSDGFDD